MRKPRTNSEKSQATIVDAALALLRERGASKVTVGDVAAASGCAKGLIHYHFKTKGRLWVAVAERLAAERREGWIAVFDSATPTQAVERSWALLVSESGDGTLRAWTSLFGSGTSLPEQLVSSSLTEFSEALGAAVSSMFESHGAALRIGEAELGWFLGSVVAGVGYLLLAGAAVPELEGAYTTAWLGVLSLTA
ncbi:MAG: TetR/AcrR family transcriptional regulator [Gemmatimonadota bacterium]|nr:TetR/AcrR family transcriptional regulator [Gemmatimonadota bacterium]MDH3367137.1 TetR/AcrR family transcriptional regulator [Gemmatimonadota bacterium]MDH3476895.1 TetR/AcrR family transcriptional regulator [Gemmatimonadota bacterium]MDH5548301.1 TetR/AcrR family transcriptional regulator [Gemmatimonadota bacterium]